MKNIFFIFILFILSTSHLLGDNTNIDNLHDKLNSNISEIEKGKIYSDLCWILRWDSTEASLKYGNKAIEIFENNNNLVERCKIYNRVGLLYRNTSNYIKSLTYFYKVLEIAEEPFCNEEIGHAYNNIGYFFYYIEQKSNSLNYFFKARDYFQKSNSKIGISYNLQYIALCYESMGKLDSAIMFNYECLDYRLKMNNNKDIINTLINTSNIHFKLNNIDSCYIYLKRAESYLTKSDYIQISHINYRLGIYYDKINDKTQAIKYFELANNNNADKNYPCYDKACEYLYRLYQERNDMKNSYKSLELSLITNNFIKNNFNKNNIGFTALEFEKNRIENQKKIEIKEYEYKIRQQRILTITLIIFLLIGAILVYILYKNYILVTKTNYLLSLKNEEIKVKELSIETKNNQLNELNKTKDKFFSIIAHDLRTPFIGFMKLSKIILNDDDIKNNSRIINYVQLIYDSAKNSQKLLDNLYEWTKSQSENLDFKLESLNLHNLLNNNIEIFNFQSITKKITITNHVNYDYNVFVDKNMANTIFRNIISNAIKFTDTNGNIDIYANRKGNFIEIIIEDDGVGIRENNLKDIFAIKVKTFSKDTEGNTGTGLGLILCKEFVEKNEGKIWIESTEGIGTRVHIILKHFNNHLF